MSWYVRKVSLGWASRQARHVAGVNEVHVVPLADNFSIECFGFRLNRNGKVHWFTNRVRPVSIYISYGYWKQSKSVHCYSPQGERFAFCFYRANPVDILQTFPYAYLIRERDGVIKFWNFDNYGYSLHYNAGEKRWYGTFVEPFASRSMFPGDELAGFRFEEIPTQLSGRSKYISKVGDGIATLRSDGVEVTYEVMDRFFTVDEGMNFGIGGEYQFFKLPYQDRIVVQRGDFTACYETRYLPQGNPDVAPFGRYFVRRFPMWKQNVSDLQNRVPVNQVSVF